MHLHVSKRGMSKRYAAGHGWETWSIFGPACAQEWIAASRLAQRRGSEKGHDNSTRSPSGGVVTVRPSLGASLISGSILAATIYASDLLMGSSVAAVAYMPVVRNSVGLVPKNRRKTLAK
jgi:hypothetical protein